nr:reverse transcriptase domain-containing protein [Tanacetum cinerariifolium]
MDYLHTTEVELGIKLDIPLSMQDPLDKLNDLAKKKRKHDDDIHEYFKAIKRLKSLVKYRDHLLGTMLNEPVLGKGSQGKKLAVTLKPTSVDVSDESNPEPAKRQTRSRRSRGVVIQDIPNVPKKKQVDHSQKMKGIRKLSAEEQFVADTMQEIKNIKKPSRSQPHARGSSKGTGISPRVPNESTNTFKTSSEGAGIKPRVPNEVNEEEIEWVSTDEQEEHQDDQDDDDDDRRIYIKETYDDEITNDEFVHNDEYVHDNDYVHNDVEEEMKDAEFDVTGKDNEEITDAKKIEARKGDHEQTGKLSPTSSSLSVSFGFEINSLLDIQIQQEVPQILSLTLLNGLVFVIPKPPVSTPTLTLTTETLVSKILSHPLIKQQTTPILTPVITTIAPSVTIFVPHLLLAIIQRVSELEKDIKDLKQVDHSSAILASIRSHSYEKQPSHKDLYDALTKSSFMDEDDMDKAAAATGQFAQFIRKHDDQDEDLTTRSDQGKDKKRPRKDTQPLKESSATKESSKGNTHPKSLKSGSSVTAEEPDEEHVHDMSPDAEENIADEMGNIDEHPNDKITKVNLVGPFYNLLKGTCQSSIELAYNMKECYKALTDRLDWQNPEGDRCPFNLSKPLPLKDRPGHLTVASEYFFNNYLEYLKYLDLEKKYATSITKMKASRFSKHDVFFPLKILSVVSVTVNKLHGYGYLEDIMVRRDDRQKYKFKEEIASSRRDLCMRTCSSSNLYVESSPNPTSLNPKRRNRRRLKQPFILEESPIYTIADQCTMEELLRATTEGYAEAIVVPLILAERFELKHSLINMMTSDQFFGLEKNNPHDHIRWFNKITSTIKYKDVPNSSIKLMLFPFSLFDVSFHEAWDGYKDLLRACPHHGFTELHQLDTFYNALNPADQDSLNSPAGGNLDANSSSSSEIAKLTHAVNQQTSDVTTAMTAILKQFQATPPPASVKSVEEICVTCGGAHSYYQFIPLSELEKIKRMNETNMKVMQTQINNMKNELRNEMKILIQASMSNQTNELKNMMASFFQMNIASTSGLGPLPSNTIANLKGESKAITTRSGIVLDGPFVLIPPPFINPEEDERVEETLTDQDLAECTIKVPPPPEKLLELANIPLNENCSAVILKKLPKILGDPGKFLILCDFSELKCKALADLGASINLMPLSVWKKLGLPELISTRMTLELANQAICTPAGIARDVFVPVGKFTFPADFVIVDYESDPRVPLILGRPFLQTARDLIDGDNVLIEKVIKLDSTKDLLPPHNINPLSGSTTSSSPNHLLEEFGNELALITFPPGNDDLPNLANPNDNLFDTMLEMFTDEHALYYSSPPLYDEYDDDLFEIESDIEYVYDDPFDSKEEKIKESKLLIDELDPLRSSDFLPSLEYDSFLFEDFFEVDAFPSNNNEDKNEKKISISHASLILEDFDPPLSDYELPFQKEVPGSETLLSFSSENEEKVLKPGILTSKGV